MIRFAEILLILGTLIILLGCFLIDLILGTIASGLASLLWGYLILKATANSGKHIDNTGKHIDKGGV